MSILENTLQDLRFGARALRKNPAVTAIAALSLALGIGANTAIFSLIDAVLLKPLPVRDPQALVLLSDPTAQGIAMGSHTGVRQLFSYEEFERIRQNQRVFSDVYASESYTNRVGAFIDGAASEDIRPRLVSASYFSTLGVTPTIGRTFTIDDERGPHSAPYAVISHAYWNRRFNHSPAVLGKVIRIGKASLTVIGVTPSPFFGETVGDSPDAWIPLNMLPDVKPGREWLHDDESSVKRFMWLHIMGRLKPGVGMQQAQANIDVVFQQILSSYQIPGLTPARQRDFLDQQARLHEGGKGASELRDSFSTPLLVLMTVVGLVLLIACANIANLLLARAAARQKEIAVRIALGAGRARLALQFLTESLILAVIGAGLGVLLAAWGSRLLLQIVSSGPDMLAVDARIDARVLAFTAAVAILTGILFGLAPALRTSKIDVAPVLKDNARAVTSSGSRLHLGKLLVVAQIAISLLLLIGSGLFIRTLRNLQHVELGYPREQLITLYLDSQTAGYKGQAALDLFRRVQDDIRAIPGVQNVSFSQNGLFSGSDAGTSLEVEGYTPTPPAKTSTSFDSVGPDYFSALGIPLLRGREIAHTDLPNSTPVCVINESMARDFFANRDPIGKHIRDLFPGSKGYWEIVGVVRNVRDHNLRGDVRRRYYTAAVQSRGETAPGFNYEIRTSGEPSTILATVRRKIREIDPALRIEAARTLDETIARELNQERVIAQLSTFFGGLALLLASVGLYGVLSYAVTRRTNEIGIRMAIGAGQGTVVWMILRETLILVAIGTIIGLAAAISLARLVASSLYGVGSADPLTMIAATATLVLVATFAACFPALHAARVDPLIALRVE